jgi:hypothetical protein
MARGTSRARRVRWIGRVRATGGLPIVAAGVSLALALAAPAGAAQSYTWAGGSASSARWSAPSNWSTFEAPASFSSIGALEFPLLSRATCESSRPEEACYFSENNLSGVSVESLHVDDRAEYVIYGEPFTLGSGGLSAAPLAETSELTLSALLAPIVLGAAQTWNIGGWGAGSVGENQLYVGGGVSGSEHALTIDVGSGGGLDFGGDAEVGPVAIDGANATQAGIFNGVVGLFGGRLNSADGNAVSLSHVFFYGAGSVGALSTAGAELDLAIGGEPPEGTLEAASVTLDPATDVAFEIANTGATPGSDYSRLLSHGAIALGGAEVRVRGPESCATLPPGRVYTLVSTSGALSGAFGNAPAGGEIPIAFPKACGLVKQRLRIAYNESGPLETVTGTVIAGESSSTTLSASPATPSTNQSVKLTATVLASSGLSTGSVEFQNGGAAIPGCAAQPVGSDVATCQTSFSAGASPARLAAIFTPGAGVNLQGSLSETSNLAVAQGSTTTALRVSNATPLVGGGVTYTATVTPANAGASVPSGAIEFLDANVPIGSCAGQPLGGAVAGAASASCQLSYLAPGTHAIAARYAGDANFTGSSSAPAQTVTVTAPAPSGGVVAGQQIAGATAQGGGVRLTGSALAARGDVALVKLRCTAPGGCRGKLSLSTQASSQAKHAGGRSRTVRLGSSNFAVGAGETKTVHIALDAAARALLHASPRLPARLTIAEVGTGLEQTQAHGVRIVEQPAGRSKRRGR